jgi:hypothetical protein
MNANNAAFMQVIEKLGLPASATAKVATIGGTIAS